MSSIDQEREAIAKLQRGDIQGLEILVRLYQSRALRVALALTQDPDLAEDIVAEAFLTVYNRAGQFDSQRSFSAWFYRIVINAGLKAYRKRGRETCDETSARILARAEDAHPGPEAEALSAETREQVGRAIKSLPVNQRAVVIMRYYLGMDDRTIAQALGCPLGTVKWRLHAAHMKLRPVLAVDSNPHLASLSTKGETS